MAEAETGTARLAAGCTALAAAGVMLNAVTHLDLYVAGGFRDIDVIGPLFLLDAIAGLAISVVMLMGRDWLPLLAATGFSVATLVAEQLRRLFHDKERDRQPCLDRGGGHE